MPIELSRDDRERCQDLATQLLDRTLRDRDELDLSNDNHAGLDNRRWKKLQSHPDLTLYAERNPNSVWIPAVLRDEWLHPISVVGVGRMECSLDDVLLAAMLPDAATQRLRSLLMGQRIEPEVEYIPIVRPTRAMPFHFVALIRCVNMRHWPLTLFTGPREFVLLCATGEMVDENGVRVGYEVIQSVSRQSTGVDLNSSMQRSQLVQARVFWELPDRSVMVYNKFIVDAKNHLPDSVNRKMLCSGLLSFWKFVPRCVEIKKFRWCLKFKNDRHERKSWSPRDQSPVKCAGCGVSTARNLGKGSTVNWCELCDAWLCTDSLCRANCQFKMVHSCATSSYEQNMAICQHCKEFVRSRRAVDVALADC